MQSSEQEIESGGEGEDGKSVSMCAEDGVSMSMCANVRVRKATIAALAALAALA